MGAIINGKIIIKDTDKRTTNAHSKIHHKAPISIRLVIRKRIRYMTGKISMLNKAAFFARSVNHNPKVILLNP